MTEGPWGKFAQNVPQKKVLTEEERFREVSRCATTIRKELRSMERNDFPNLKPVDLYTWDENIGGNGTVKFMAFYEKKGSPVSLNKVEQIVRSAVALHEGPLNTAGYTAKVERIAEHVENDVRISNGVFVTFERLKTD